MHLNPRFDTQTLSLNDTSPWKLRYPPHVSQKNLQSGVPNVKYSPSLALYIEPSSLAPSTNEDELMPN
jgi:hypothetical protein